MLLHFLFFLFTLPFTMALGNSEGAITNDIAKPDCPTHCGNITVPYPFGIGTQCSLHEWFSLTCNTSNNETPKLFLGDEKNNTRIYNINISDSQMRIFTHVSYKCYGLWSTLNIVEPVSSITFGTPKVFFFSENNRFTVVGCDDFAMIFFSQGVEVEEEEFAVGSGCFGICQNVSNVSGGQCTGAGCCQIPLPKIGVTNYSFALGTVLNHSLILPDSKCGYGFLVEEDAFEFGGTSDLTIINPLDFVDRIESTMPIVIDWVIEPNKTCAADQGVNACKGNSSCHDVESGGYSCRCKDGYEGNPYLDQGCQDIDECNDPITYPCHGICKNNAGNYSCICKSGSGDVYMLNGCKENDSMTMVLVTGASAGVGVLFLIGVSYLLYKVIKKAKETKQRKRFFERNGGLLLKQQKEADPSLVDKTILFTSNELEKATDNFNETRILGRGGHGTVYKGMLVDGRIVAVKKSKIVDESQLEQFINEVVILSQVNHRNVVKLLGCCLETDVPLLVSEFIPNGTLYDNLHNETEDFPISLNMRLQIATEVAGALAYLHSATSIPIYHRDIKTSNILLDEKYRAKVSDFGTSRFVSIEQTHLTTIVKGTFGYLDPEYFQSNQFTEKSDVYSFGVVLVELLTKEKPISHTRFGDNKSLATHFLFAMEKGRVMSIFDALVIKEGTREDLLALSNLAMRCLNLNGKYRPTMKEVATELEIIRTSHIPSTVQANVWPNMYTEELSMLPYEESSSTRLSFNDSIN